jgi:hypothetical protein
MLARCDGGSSRSKRSKRDSRKSPAVETAAEIAQYY